MLLVIFLLFSSQINNIVTISDKIRCKLTPVGFICKGIEYLPEALIKEATNKPEEIGFQNIVTDIDLKIPINYHNTSQVVYSGFKIFSCCVKSIEENFFVNLDRMKKILKTIRFQNVKCLESLSTKSFIGIGEFLENLHFINLTNLVNIDGDFFNNFTKLKRLTITSTKINWIPETMLKLMPNIITIKISNNKLTKMPIIPLNNPELIKNFESFGNPFDCVCSLMDFIQIMDKKLTDKYYCETPKYLNQTKLQILPDLCTTTTMKMETVKVQEVSDAKMRIEIIAAVAVVLLIMVVIIIIVVVIKQKKKDPQDKVIYTSGSPSKIIYQDESYQAFIQQNQRV